MNLFVSKKILLMTRNLLFLTILIFLSLNVFSNAAFSQVDTTYHNGLLDSLKAERDWFDSVNTAKKDSLALVHKSDPESSPSVLPVVYGVAGFLYLFNPIVLLENDKIVAGITKEISIGFGDFGENRIAFEYSFLFRQTAKSHYRISVKHDFLLDKDIKPSNLLQAVSVVSIGAGYFTDLSYSGVFPEVSYGFSIRNNKLLLYPHIKLRYTFIFSGDTGKSDILDLSLGFMIGFANPFIDTKIRRKY